MRAAGGLPFEIRTTAPSDFVTGGGYLDTADGAGSYAPGNRTDVNLNVHWGMPGFHSLFGQSRLRFSSGGTNYEIDAISYDSLGVLAGDNHGQGIAQVEARAKLIDRDHPGRTITLRPDVRLQLRVTDLGETGSVGFALWDDNGRLLAASGWDIDQPPHIPEVLHGGGNSQVHIFEEPPGEDAD